MRRQIAKMLFASGLIAVCGIVAAPSHALGRYPFAIPCDECSNPTIDAVIREGYANQSSWFVYDLKWRTLRFYRKVASSRGNFSIQEQSVDAATLAYWNEVLDFYDRNGRSLSLTVRVTPNLRASSYALRSAQPSGAMFGSGTQLVGSATPGVISAWDAVNEGPDRQAVVNYLNNNSTVNEGGIFSRAAELVGTTYAKITTIFGGVSADQLRLNIQALGLYVVVAYPDGSSQKYSWDPLDHSWTYVPRTSVDSSGNAIPDGSSDVAGQNGTIKVYSFPATVGGSVDAIQWYQRVSMFSVSAPSPATPSVIACVTTGSGGAMRTTCTRQR